MIEDIISRITSRLRNRHSTIAEKVECCSQQAQQAGLLLSFTADGRITLEHEDAVIPVKWAEFTDRLGVVCKLHRVLYIALGYERGVPSGAVVRTGFLISYLNDILSDAFETTGYQVIGFTYDPGIGKWIEMRKPVIKPYYSMRRGR